LASETIKYSPPPTVSQFIKAYLPGELFYNWIVGPFGSGKTTGLFFKLAYMASKQAPQADGIRRTRAVIVRNTMPQLKDTTIKSWFYWFKDGQAGKWDVTNSIFTLKFGDVECEVLFRPLDTARDVARVLSLEVTFAILDEFVEIGKEIVDALSVRCGRYPSMKDGGATNWGMWGSSNTSTEDNWWYDHLENNLPTNERYFHQPGGFTAEAENIENLPGGREYYTNQAKGKADAWIKQYIDAEWGYSEAGKAVVSLFKSERHLSKGRVAYNPNLPIVVGFDPGLAGSAFIFGQCDLHDRLRVLGELIQIGYGTERLITERLRPFLRQNFPDAQVIIAPDPAASNRAQTDEVTSVQIMRKYYRVVVETNNHLAKRLDAIDYFAGRITDVGDALLIDPVMCPVLVRALRGGWRYEMQTKIGREGTTKTAEPENNKYTHPGDAFGYLCRYFHRQNERQVRQGDRPISSAARYANAYHVQ
jgi:hypothetical protein